MIAGGQGRLFDTPLSSYLRYCMGVNGEALQLRTVYKKPYFLLQVTRQSVSVLQVTRESVSGTTSHARIHIRYYKSRTLRLNVQ